MVFQFKATGGGAHNWRWIVDALSEELDGLGEKVVRVDGDSLTMGRGSRRALKRKLAAEVYVRWSAVEDVRAAFKRGDLVVENGALRKRDVRAARERITLAASDENALWVGDSDPAAE